MILSITRSTSRLTAGARAVDRGDLDYRVPVKRHDQLGDLARSFNHMTDSVQSMLADVAEKERLARELELAREIQESLLPARYLEVGPVSVQATFQPATEVGGDYFDVFPISEDRLVVTIGDVAGHGLSTGLLMASLKSSVAALVYEGYEGTDLIEKVNHLLMEHGQMGTMATLAVVEIELARASAWCSPMPAIVRRSSSTRMGGWKSSWLVRRRWAAAFAVRHRWTANSRSAAASSCTPTGWWRRYRPTASHSATTASAEVVMAATDCSGSVLTTTILDALAKYADGVPAADDLTILVVERSLQTEPPACHRMMGRL